jgi:hypothetical protein
MSSGDIMSIALDELYSSYESDHSMETVRWLHPMFQNGTFSENNSYQPPNPGELLSKDEFIDKLNTCDKEFGEKWNLALRVLFSYISKQNRNE